MLMCIESFNVRLGWHHFAREYRLGSRLLWSLPQHRSQEPSLQLQDQPCLRLIVRYDRDDGVSQYETKLPRTEVGVPGALAGL
jgi:hypothetical protein